MAAQRSRVIGWNDQAHCLQDRFRFVLQPWYGRVRGLTLGTRSVVLDHDDRVLLLRHTYAPGWFLPAAGVERGETIYDAALRSCAKRPR